MTNKKPQEDLCVIIVIIQDMYDEIVGSYRIKNGRFQFVPYQKLLKSASTPISILVESGKTNTCFFFIFLHMGH